MIRKQYTEEFKEQIIKECICGDNFPMQKVISFALKRS